MPQLCVGNQAHPHDWDVASCSRKYKYDMFSIMIVSFYMIILLVVVLMCGRKKMGDKELVAVMAYISTMEEKEKES